MKKQKRKWFLLTDGREQSLDFSEVHLLVSEVRITRGGLCSIWFHPQRRGCDSPQWVCNLALALLRSPSLRDVTEDPVQGRGIEILIILMPYKVRWMVDA